MDWYEEHHPDPLEEGRRPVRPVRSNFPAGLAMPTGSTARSAPAISLMVMVLRRPYGSAILGEFLDHLFDSCRLRREVRGRLLLAL